MGKEKSPISIRFCPALLLGPSLQPVLLLNESVVSPVHFLSSRIEYLRFLRKIFYKLQDCYLSPSVYLKDINKHIWPNYGVLWKPIPVTG